MSLSTHVLNTTTGLPEQGLAFELYRADSADSAESADSAGGNTAVIESGVTDTDGRYRFNTPLEPGTYRIRFATGDALGDTPSLYPYVDITFLVKDERGGANGHLHIPLLLSPFGYSTYQGS